MVKQNKILKFSINSILFGVYLFLVWSIYLFIQYCHRDISVMGLVGMLVLCVAAVFCVTKWLMRFISGFPFFRCMEFTRKKSILCYCIFSGISFAILFLWYFAYYPGAFSSDSLYQYTQAITGSYNDWHPVWHTLLFFKFPLMLTGRVASIVLFQIIYFALILGYLALTIYQFSNLKAAVIALGYILLNPYTGCIAMFPWKDVAMAITILWLMVCVARLYCTNGQWALKRGRVVLVALLLANATLFRHNALLFTVPMVIALFFQLSRKKWVELAVIFFAFLFVVKGPIYSALDVEKPGERRIEMVGLPLAVIANVTREHPEALDEKTADFIYQIAPQEMWEERYICGNFNSIKWAGIDTSIVERTSTFDILWMTLRCFKTEPKSACKALFMLTDAVYSIDGEIEEDCFPNIEDNEVGIVYQGSEGLQNFLQWYKKIVSETIFKYVRYIGISMLIMLAFILNKSNLKSWNDWKRIFLCIPIFLYNFGTMLLLTGPDSRFFYVSFLVCPVVVLVMINNRGENHNCKE